MLQCLGWTIFELIVIATAAGALSSDIFGFEAKWLWTIVFGALSLVLGLLGPIGVVRTFVRRISVWAVPLAVAYLTWWAFSGANLGTLWNRPGAGAGCRSGKAPTSSSGPRPVDSAVADTRLIHRLPGQAGSLVPGGYGDHRTTSMLILGRY